MLNKIIPLDQIELKRASLTADGTITAYASTFGDPPDSVGDIIVEGAFAPAIAAHNRANTMPAMFLHHDHKDPVGVWLSMAEDSHGLLMTGKISDTTRGKDAKILLADGAFSFSIGFRIAENGSRQVGATRYISKIDLLGEVSLVSIPANPKAKLVSMKSLSEGKRVFEKVLREAGGSRKSARRITAGVFGGSTDCDGQSLQRINNAIECLIKAIDHTEV